MQAARRTMARVRYRLIDQRREHLATTVEVDGRVFEVAAGVFNPVVHVSGAAFALALGAEWFPADATVVDLACGTGILAVFAAPFAAEVTATDISATAVACARGNVKRHGLEHKIEVREADLLRGLGRFDVILCNPPYEVTAPTNTLDLTLASPDFFERLGSTAGNHLTSDGKMLLALPADHGEPLEILRESGLHCQIFKAISTPVADLTIWRVTAA